MTYHLAIGDKAYSSWSLRGWLLFEKFGLPVQTHSVSFAKGPAAPQMPDFAPAQTVPAMKTPDGVIVSDSLAMAEELASRHPEIAFWPTDPALRGAARSLVAEMHSGFGPLRAQCPMNVRTAFDWDTPTPEVLEDVARIEALWAYARSMASDGPWLFGAYSVADVFYAPVAARIAGYTLSIGAEAREYVHLHLGDLAMRRWRAMALVRGETLERYAQPHPVVAWPGPEAIAANATDRTDAENEVCPYSGKPLADYLELADGRVFGFCNPFCRDKTVADPAAWPAFVEMAGLH